jgi:sec-independent protein translocase protein TatA
MGSFSLWHWVIVLLVVLLLFGRGRLSEVMGDFAKGIKSFKKGLADDETPAPTQQIQHPRDEQPPHLQAGGVPREEIRRS